MKITISVSVVQRDPGYNWGRGRGGGWSNPPSPVFAAARRVCLKSEFRRNPWQNEPDSGLSIETQFITWLRLQQSQWMQEGVTYLRSIQRCIAWLLKMIIRSSSIADILPIMTGTQFRLFRLHSLCGYAASPYSAGTVITAGV